MSNWIVDRCRILQRDEIALVLTDLRRKARRSTNSRMNMVVFRLATCCGLRASEIGGLVLADVQVDNSRPSIRVRREIGKGHKARKVPLTWDAGTLADLVEWKRFRREQGAADDDRFVCSQHCDSLGRSIVEVRAAAGHASLATTSIYAHLVDTDDKVGNLFDFGG